MDERRPSVLLQAASKACCGCRGGHVGDAEASSKLRAAGWERHVHGVRRQEARHPRPPHGHRGAAVERLMGPRVVVERDPGRDPGTRLEAVGIALQIDLLVLQRSPQPLDEDVVQPTAAAVHRDSHAGSLQDRGECGRGELAALIGVEDRRPAEPASASSSARTQRASPSSRHWRRIDNPA